MAAPTKHDRILAADVRKLALTQIMYHLNGNDEEFKKQLLLKLATTVLPRINEHSGPDGGEITFTPIYGGLSTNGITITDTSNGQ